MFTNATSILQHNLPEENFKEICRLWERIKQLGGNQVFLVTEESLDLPRENNLVLRLLITKEFVALVLGEKNKKKKEYQVSITFDVETIILFLNQNIQLPPDCQEIVDKLVSKPLDFSSSLFNQLLKQLLESAFSISSLPTLSSSHFNNYQSLEMMLRNRLEQERILHQVTLQISDNLDLLVIVKMTIEQVQHLLQLDRLVIYQLDVEVEANASEELNRRDGVTYEARASDLVPSILHFQEEDCFTKTPECAQKYRQGFTLVIDNIEQAELEPCLRKLMDKLQIKAKIVTPILVQNQIWGFLIAHQCFAPRHWKNSEAKFLRNIAQYLAIAVYQAQSYSQLKKQQNLLQEEVQKRAQDLKDALLAAQIANQYKTEFIGNISHELRTPLTCIIGLSGTLISQLDNPNYKLTLEKQRHYLQTVQDSGRKLLDLVNNILDFSQVEAGKSLLNISDFSLNRLAREVLHNLQDNAKNHEIILEMDYLVESKADIFSGDRERLYQILSHLLDNGIKFTPAGGRVILRLWREKDEVVFQVEDTGIGISLNNLPIIFEKFQQLENSRIRQYSGTGLSLALTKQIVELHRGRIEVESTVGKGSIFTIYIPNNWRKKNNIIPENLAQNKTVIIIEEEEDTANLICELLTAANYQVIWLVDSFSALRRIELLQPSTVLLNKALIDVEKLVKKLRTKKTTRYVKIIVVSKQMTSEEWERLVILGVDDFIITPIQPNLLLQKINNI